MDFSDFEKSFLYNLEKRSEDCFSDISNNRKIISEYLSNNNDKILNSFVNKFNDILIRSDKDFDFYENILNEKLFYEVLKAFRDSNILIRACEAKNINLLKWLLTMDINTCVQNEYGVSALMAASNNSDLVFVVKYLLQHDTDNLNLCDKNGETALFYAIRNIDALRLLLDANINANRLNKNNDTVLTYCCRNKIYEPIKTLSVKDNVDVNVFDNDEKTALMYLLNDFRIEELKFFISDRVNFDFKNRNNETALSIFFKNYYESYRQLDIEKILQYIKIIQIFVQKRVNLNVSIDEEGNTPMMFFLMIEDWITMAYIMINYPDMDLSIKNKKGKSFSGLCENHKPTKESAYSGIIPKILMYHLFAHPTFNAGEKGIAGNNVLMNYIINYVENFEINFKEALKAHKEFKSVTNDNQENLLMIAVKLGRHDIIKHIVPVEGGDINQQDVLGNTALHYAVMLNDCVIADLLAYNHADINIKNNDGLSPVNIAKNSGNSTLYKLLLKPCPSYKVEKMGKKGNSIFNFGKGNDLGEYNENLRRKYQEKLNEEIRINEKKLDEKYAPLDTPKFNTEYYTDVFKAYFPRVVDAFSNNPVTVLSLERSTFDCSTDIQIQGQLYNMLTNKQALRFNCYLNNLDYSTTK